jgi:ribosomal protein L24E
MSEQTCPNCGAFHEPGKCPLEVSSDGQATAEVEKKEEAWVQQVRKLRETQEGPSQSDIEEFVEDVMGTHFRRIPDGETPDSYFFETIRQLRRFADGKLSDNGQTPDKYKYFFAEYYEVPDFSRYLPEDFKTMVEAFEKRIVNNQPWSVEAMKHQDEVTEDRIQKIVKHYSSRSVDPMGLRDLKLLAIGINWLGDLSTMPVDLSGLTPFHFQRIVEEVEKIR